MFETGRDSDCHKAMLPHSVTALLRAESGHNVIADVIQEGWRMPTHRERLMLCRYKLPYQPCWVREVLLFTNGNIRAIARVLVPRQELYKVRWVQHLGAQPLGSVLFNRYNPQRECITREFSWFVHVGRHFSLRARTHASELGFNPHESYWLRSSVLHVKRKNIHLLVTECFLQ